jgi:hypothetical protein
MAVTVLHPPARYGKAKVNQESVVVQFERQFIDAIFAGFIKPCELRPRWKQGLAIMFGVSTK